MSLKDAQLETVVRRDRECSNCGEPLYRDKATNSNPVGIIMAGPIEWIEMPITLPSDLSTAILKVPRHITDDDFGALIGTLTHCRLALCGQYRKRKKEKGDPDGEASQ